MHDTITVFGDVNLDILVKAKEDLSYDGDINGLIELQPGGAGLNIGIWAKRAEPEININLLSKIGTDFIGDYIIRYLDNEKIRLCVPRDDYKMTGKTLIQINKMGGRSIISFKGANFFIDIKDINEKIIQDSKIVHISGYTLLNDVQRNVAMHLCDIANKLNVPVSLNLAAHNQLLEEKNEKKILSILDNFSIIFANYDEGRAITKKDKPISIVKTLAKHVDISVLTLGKEGCIATNGCDIFREKSNDVRAIDTTGAGDAFTGIFLAKYIKGVKFEDCIKFATKISTRITQKLGAVSTIQSR